MKQITFAIAALISAVFVTGASAQNQLSGGVMDSISSAEVIQLVQNNGLTAKVVGQTDTNELVEVKTSNGNVFYMSLRNCQPVNGSLRCRLIQPTAIFNASGVTLGMANELHKSKLVLAYVTLAPENRGTIFSKIILSGGVTTNNILEELSRYLRDVEVLFQSITPGTQAMINFETEDVSAGIIMPDVGKHLASDDALFINPVGANAGKFLTEELKAYLD